MQAYYDAGPGAMWANCDMVAAVAIARLDRVRHVGCCHTLQMPAADLAAIIEGVQAALGIR